MMARGTTFLEANGVPELLAPAGGPEPFNAALAAGADAIYCGLGNDFNARRGAHNFDDESFAAACRRAHLAGARVYVTVNVAVSTEEMPRVLELVRRAWELGADAFIIQDWGLMAEIRRRWPEVETHVSTQANVHDARGVAWCRDTWGVDRVTLSRELSLAEISRIAEEGVELECFGHGALCFCYSGVCLMSSLNGGRSANRGLCAQPCRLPYDLIDEDGNVMEIPGVATQGLPEKSRGVGGTRLLCPKDYCTVDHLSEMRDAGVGSLKVEGRMKAPDYVLSVVGSYRDALDALAAGEDSEAAAAARHRRLKRAFNRDFTDSYLWGRSDNDMMSYERSNNRGEVVGEVVGSRQLEDAVVRRGGGNGGRERMRRLTRADVEVRLTAPVDEGDLLELRPVDDPTQFLTAPAPADAAAGETIICRAARPMPAGSVVRLIRSQRALDEVARVADKDVVRRRPVCVRVTARLGEPFSVALSCADGAASARAEGFVVEAARTREVIGEELVEHVGRMGQSPFEPVEWDVTLDSGCGMSFSAVHKVRAEACARLEEALLAPYTGRGACEGGSPLRTPPCLANDLRTRDRPGMRRGSACRRRDVRLCPCRRPRRGRVARGGHPLAGRDLPRGGPRAPGRLGSRRRARGGGQRLGTCARRGARRAARGPLLRPGAQRVLPRGPGGRGRGGRLALPGAHARRGLRARPRGARPRGTLGPGPRARDDERALRAAGARPMHP